MKQEIINEVMQGMAKELNNAQLQSLQQVLEHSLFSYTITTCNSEQQEQENQKYIEAFIAAKRVEGCSEKTIKYYQTTIEKMITEVNRSVRKIVTDDLRLYLTEYQHEKNLSKVTVDNVRRILSSFFSWLEDEDYILKSPVRRIHKVKTTINIKETYSDESLELMRDNCTELRDLAMIDMLSSTGMRVGEMVLLNKSDVNFSDRECVVLGKGDKERIVYFDARTKIHLMNYLESRTDNNEALFVSLKGKHDRLKIGGIG